MKSHYFLKLFPCRPTFALDMTDAERAIMGQHLAYLKGHQAPKEGQPQVLVFGPVMDPTGPYGMAIVAADNEEEVRTLTANDPASQLNHYEFYPMRAVLPG